MSERRLPPPPKWGLDRAWKEWEKWFSRVTTHVPLTVRVDATIDPASVSANTTAEEAFTVEGARDGDMVVVTKPTHTAGLGIVNARVSDTDEVSITFMNPTGSGVNPPSETYRFWLMRWNER